MTFSSDRLRDTLEFCMMEGKALIIAGVEEDIDPMLTPVLEKQARAMTFGVTPIYLACTNLYTHMNTYTHTPSFSLPFACEMMALRHG